MRRELARLTTYGDRGLMEPNDADDEENREYQEQHEYRASSRATERLPRRHIQIITTRCALAEDGAVDEASYTDPVGIDAERLESQGVMR
jgi:hypothetical protein